jgi:hypothetical protein
MRSFQSTAYSQRIAAGSHVIQIRYLPVALQVFNRAGLGESTTVTRELLDSLKRLQMPNGAISFVMTLGPADTSKADFSNDVIFGGLSGYSNYREAVQAYQFGLKDKIWLEADGKKYPLSAYTLENNWGMTQDRNFFLVFNPPADASPDRKFEFQLVLDDIVPGLARRKITWTLPIGEYDALI